MTPAGSPIFLSVVVPAYNEAVRIAATIATIREALDRRMLEWELLVVDDGSTDDGAAVASAAAAGDRRVVIVSAAHAGKGAAVRRGMLQARGAWRLLSDADLSTPIGEVDRLLAIAAEQDADVVIGSRQGAGATRVGEPEYRHLIGRLFNWAVQAAVFRGIDDTQCGFKLFSRRAADALFAVQRLDGFGFDVEVLYLASRAGFTVSPVPVTWTYDGNSKVTLASGLGGFVDIGRVRWNAMTGVYERVLQGATQ
jgi:glycosyltransferase involved in cell wall biosynthesis